MQGNMIWRLVIGVVLGAAMGGALGYFGKCTSGACPLTSNPWSGAIFGALLGALIALGAGAGK